jgi:ADP-heptose:LPS heptosyltransferase
MAAGQCEDQRSAPPGDLLVVRPGALGDALLAAPALDALRRARPANRLVFIAHPAVGPLLLARGLVDHFIPRDAPPADALFAPSPRLAREHYAAVSAAVAWSADPDGLLRANLSALGADPLVVAPSRPSEIAPHHVAAHLLRSLAPFGAFRLRSDAALLRRSTDASPGPARQLPPTVLLHVGSGSPSKNWPAAFFAALTEALRRSTGAAIRILAGPADEQPLAEYTANLQTPPEVLAHRPLIELADLLEGCDLYVGNDSGISHLAGLCGAPTLAIFGPTDPRLWRPLGPRVRVLRGQPLESLALETVLDAALRLLGQ